MRMTLVTIDLLVLSCGSLALQVEPQAEAEHTNAHMKVCSERLHEGRRCGECMAYDHGNSGQAFLMCAAAGFDCHCSVRNTSLPHPRMLQRGLSRAAWQTGDDAHKAYHRLQSLKAYAPSVLRPSQPTQYGSGSWIIQFENFTTPEEAQALISAAGDRWTRGVGGQSSAQRAARTNAVAWCRSYSNPLINNVVRKIEHAMGIDRNHFEDMQLTKYHPGEFFRRHHDSYDGAFGAQEMGHRIATIFLYLSDAGGGETRFTDLPGKPAVQPQRGRAIVWPNVWTAEPSSHDFRMMHEASTVTAGIKYGANVWVRMYERKGDLNYPLPSVCDLCAHPPPPLKPPPASFTSPPAPQLSALTSTAILGA